MDTASKNDKMALFHREGGKVVVVVGGWQINAWKNRMGALSPELNKFKLFCLRINFTSTSDDAIDVSFRRSGWFWDRICRHVVLQYSSRSVMFFIAV